MQNSVHVLKMRTDLIHISSIEKVINDMLSVPSPSGRYICVSNVHMCMEVYDNALYQNVVNSADLVVADGRPIFWQQKLLAAKNTFSQVRGQDLFESICRMSSNSSGCLKIGLLGGYDDSVLNKLVKILNLHYPGISIVFTYSPPFRPMSQSEAASVYRNINESECDVLFVGLGCPKQENWMYEAKPHVNCVMIGIGAAFDFVSGNKKHAPKFMQKAGLEWLYRLVSEPRRLWKRYLYNNPRFIFLAVWQLLKRKA